MRFVYHRGTRFVFAYVGAELVDLISFEELKSYGILVVMNGVPV